MSSTSVIHWLIRRRVSSSRAVTSVEVLRLAARTSTIRAKSSRSFFNSIRAGTGAAGFLGFAGAAVLAGFRRVAAAFFVGLADFFLAGRRVLATVSSSSRRVERVYRACEEQVKDERRF